MRYNMIDTPNCVTAHVKSQVVSQTIDIQYYVFVYLCSDFLSKTLLSMAEMSASSDSFLYCIICNRVTQAQKRVYFRNVTEEPLFLLKQLLTKHHSEERVLNYLKEPVISCKGTCQALIRNLSKVRLRLKSLENEIQV